MKESFMALYVMLLFAFIMHQLGVTHPAVYVIRTALLCLGLMLFCVRFLLNRCARHWISLETQAKIGEMLRTIKQSIPGTPSSQNDVILPVGSLHTLIANPPPPMH